MASTSQPYSYQTIFPDDHEDEFCQLSAAHSNNVQVPHIHARGKFSTLGNAYPSPTMIYNTGAMWADDHQQTFPTHQLIDHHQISVPLKSESSIQFSTNPERLGISDMIVPDLYSSCSSFNSGNQLGPESCLYRNDLCTDFGMDCCDSDDRFKPLCHALQDIKWGIQAKQVPLIDDSSTKIGRYTAEERKDRILRYLKKRNQRNFNKTIKYACRKTLADRRVRVRGRFARNNDSCDEEIASMKKTENPQQQNDLFFGDDVQIKLQDNDDDQWLQEAMASLIYLPNYISGC
ncbi:uncharacterized protein LOC116215032 [Punica granatum]|uniref:CCT domain-containing protein n=2 Tax=Punica granatum TaxID=22663 RepID=A0A218XTQ1_PUNGR|nr:uncharacterized protein LOC116215032 [Punica granatum]OWM88525.1 hypothetical protein CDL15_Pgr002292 [Punica granatum]PKI49151.1 hypothetical protein CRG98_030497 [Punica granatum]